MGGLTTLGVEAAEKGLTKLADVGVPKAAEAAEGFVEFADKHFNVGSVLERGGQAGKFLEGLLDDHKDGTNKLISTVKQNIPTHFPNHAPNEVTSNMIKAKAAELAEPGAFGKNREWLIAGVKQFKDAHGDIRARNLADQLGVYLREQSYATSTVEGGRAPVSRLAHQLSISPKTKYQAPVAGALDEEKKLMDWGTSPYKAPGKKEEMLRKVATTPMMQRVGILHAIGGKLNLATDASLKSAARVFQSYFTDDRAGWAANAQTIGALGEYVLEKHQQALAYENGITKDLPGTAFWKGARGNFLSVGLSFAKKNNIIDFGMQGEFDAKYLADDLLSGSRGKADRARVYLSQRYGIDPDEIIANGKLTDDNIATAIDKNIERKLMTDTRKLRYMDAQATPIVRLARTFNGYATGQRNFLWRGFQNAIKAKDPMAFIKHVAILGLVYPDVGAALKYVGDLWSGKDEKESREAMLQTWKYSVTPDGYTTGKGWADRMNAMMHLTGVGMIVGHNRSSTRARALEDVGGPVIDNAVEQMADIYDAIRPGGSSTQFKRDLLYDIPAPIIGHYLSGKLFPYGVGGGRGGGGGRPKAPTRPSGYTSRPRRP